MTFRNCLVLRSSKLLVTCTACCGTAPNNLKTRNLISSAGSFKCSGYLHAIVVWKEGDNTFIGNSPVSKFNIDNIEGKQLNDEGIYLTVSPNVGICMNMNNVFIKGPEPTYYALDSNLSKTTMAEEIECLEGISKSSTHPCIVKYHGCKVEGRLVLGICLKKCPHSLNDAVDKGMAFNVNGFIQKFKQGLKLIHKVGNIMAIDNGESKITDFDSSRNSNYE
ncbi:hypothetical protein BX667DRAFT_526619 [Coemansia mojavensis]|nr:hypothetical protein BX667DRAFT_526619 [Coemansia mojavensis]